MSIGINVLNELELVLKKDHNKVFLLDVQNIADYCSEVFLEVKEETGSEEYATSWCDEATVAILAISNHFFKNGWTNTTYEEFNNVLNTLYQSNEFIDWCLRDNDDEVISTHTLDNKYNVDISNCFYIQILNDYAYFLQKVAKAKRQFMLSRLDKGYANKALKMALKLIKHTIDLYKYL